MSSYTTALDPNHVILNDLISEHRFVECLLTSGKCGVEGGTKSDITIDYDLFVRLQVSSSLSGCVSYQVLGITVHPTIRSSASFPCPISASDLQVGRAADNMANVSQGITGGGL